MFYHLYFYEELPLVYCYMIHSYEPSDEISQMVSYPVWERERGRKCLWKEKEERVSLSTGFTDMFMVVANAMFWLFLSPLLWLLLSQHLILVVLQCGVCLYKRCSFSMLDWVFLNSFVDDCALTPILISYAW